MKRVDRDPAVKSPNTKQVHNTALFVLLCVFFVPSSVCSRAFIIMALTTTITIIISQKKPQKRVVPDFTCALCSCVQQNKPRLHYFHDLSSAGVECHGNRVFLLLCAEAPVIGLGNEGPVCRQCSEAVCLSSGDAQQRVLLESLRSTVLVTPLVTSEKVRLTFAPGSPHKAALLRAKQIKATLADLDVPDARRYVGSLLQRTLPLLFRPEFWNGGYDIVPTPPSMMCLINQPGQAPRLLRFTGAVSSAGTTATAPAKYAALSCPIDFRR